MAVKYLLDTHILIWALGRVDLLPGATREILEEPAAEIYFSVASLWEIVIKAALPRRDFRIDSRDARREALGYGFRELPVTGEHIFAVSRLPQLHRDPFDRMLVAQARVEGLQLLTVDSAVQSYFQE